MMVICNACKGAGYIIVPGSKRVVAGSRDDWAPYEGMNYHHKLCPKCKGEGFIHLTEEDE